MKEKKLDKLFLGIVLLLIFGGVAMFISASLGVLARNSDLFYSVLRSQLIFGLGFGLVAMYFALKINYKTWSKYSFYIFLASILLTAAVFIPHLGVSNLGAERWIKLGSISFQPVEILKFGFVLYFAAWLSWVKNKVKDFKFGILPLVIMLSVIAVILFKQPDTKSFILITITGFSMLFISGVPWKSILSLTVGVGIVLATLVYFTPYLQERIKTFIDPSQDSQGSSYQIQQSFIALGGGGILGRGYGQSIQKFNFLPEPQGDSIFAIIGEEFGFVGAVATIVLYLLFVLRGLRIANNSPDLFSRLLVSGIVILITAQSFMHIASVVGVVPLTGVPLVFVSHGGTSLMIDLMAIGIILQISKFQHKTA
jgi:cell division protein FtsW